MDVPASESVSPPPPKLRWYQYRLRSLFILMLLVSLGIELGRGNFQRTAAFEAGDISWAGTNRDA